MEKIGKLTPFNIAIITAKIKAQMDYLPYANTLLKVSS